jgi:glycosyltransferase involved in cell wall biosynthesis
MKVALHIDPMFSRVPGGTGRYTSEIVKWLSKIDRSNEYKLMSTYSENAVLEINQPNFTFLKLSILPREVLYPMWQFLRLPGIDKLIEGSDVVHLPSLVIPPFSRKIKLVVTIHDLAFLIFPQFYTRWGQICMKRGLQIATAKTDKFIADSHFTKDQIVELTGIPEEKIKVIHLAADARYRPVNDRSEIERVLTAYKIDSEYILYLGTLEPRKNIVKLIEAFYLFRNNYSHPLKLVIGGKRGWLYQDIFNRVEELDLGKDVVFPGYIPEDDIPTLMSAATVFVYPSIYEGFGLPPLEAMSCGTPVITSNISSLPEVVGNAGIMVNPDKAEDICEAIGRVVNSPQLRQELVLRGLKRARYFSWEKTAKDTLEVYTELMQ